MRPRSLTALRARSPCGIGSGRRPVKTVSKASSTTVSRARRHRPGAGPEAGFPAAPVWRSSASCAARAAAQGNVGQYGRLVNLSTLGVRLPRGPATDNIVPSTGFATAA